MTDQTRDAWDGDAGAGSPPPQPGPGVPITQADATPPHAHGWATPTDPPPPQPGAHQAWAAQQPYPQAPPQKSRFGIGVLVGLGAGFAVAVVIAVVGFIIVGAGLFGALSDGAVGDSDPDRLNALYERCDEGDMGACDNLYWESPVDSEMEDFGATCGGRYDSWQVSCEG